MVKKTSFLLRNEKNILLIIVLIALFLRLYRLDSFPPHLRNDEASLGYNAFSILKTAKDEHGNFLPALIKSFGDFKPALYTYLTIPFISILGLDEWSVRLPAAISGIIAVYLFYYLTICLFGDKRVALFSSFLIATSPWHIAFSRGAWEAQVTVTLTIAALILFLKGLKKNILLILSGLLFGSTFLMSHSAKPSTPLLLIAILIAYGKKLLKIPVKFLLLSSVVFLLIASPVILSFFNGKNSRVESLLIFNQYKNQDLISIVDNFFLNWVNHYSFSVLFINGDGNPQYSAADSGPFLFLDLLFLILGIGIFISKGYYKSSTGRLVSIWIILSPLSSALANGGVNIVRYLSFYLLITLIMGFGLSKLDGNELPRSKRPRYPAESSFGRLHPWTKSPRFSLDRNKLKIILVLYLLFFVIFMDSYFIHTISKNGAWQTGYKEIVQFITPIQSRYEKIYVPQSSDQPYIFFLFYQKYPLEKKPEGDCISVFT